MFSYYYQVIQEKFLNQIKIQNTIWIMQEHVTKIERKISSLFSFFGYTLVYRLRLNKNLEYTKYREKYIESEYISHFGRK